MAWIATQGEGEDAARAGELLADHRDPRSGRVDAILAVHGLHAAGLAGHLALYTAVMRGTPGLPKVDRELLAFVVSGLNRCVY